MQTAKKGNKKAGERLKAFRLHFNWTREDLAYKSGVSVRTIYNYEELGIPADAAKIYPLCQALGRHIAEVQGMSILDIEQLIFNFEDLPPRLRRKVFDFLL